MKFGLASGPTGPRDSFGLANNRAAGLNGGAKKKSFFPTPKMPSMKMIPRAAALLKKTIRGGAPKASRDARVASAPPPATPAVYGPPPPPRPSHATNVLFTSVAPPPPTQSQSTPLKRPAEDEAMPATAKRAREDAPARRVDARFAAPARRVAVLGLDTHARPAIALPLDPEALARDTAARRCELAFARARAAGVTVPGEYDGAWVQQRVRQASCPDTFADRVESKMASLVEAARPAGARPLASPRVAFAAKPTKAPAPGKAPKCDKCDGPHATAACPYFKGDRDDHPDARDRAPHAALGADGGRAVLRQARVVRQPGDGSCLFHSLAHGLRDARAADFDHRRLRQALMDWLAKNEDLKIADSPVREWVLWDANQSVPHYVGRMRIGGWGGGIEMAACARKFRVDVHVYERSPAGARHPFKRISRFDAPDRPARGRVDVLYCGGVHYDGLVVPRDAVVEIPDGEATPRSPHFSPRSPQFSPRHHYSSPPVASPRAPFSSAGNYGNRYGGGHSYGKKHHRPYSAGYGGGYRQRY